MSTSQRSTVDSLLRQIHYEQGLATLSDDDDDAEDGEMVLIHHDLDEEINEAMPIRDGDENRVRVKIDEDGDVDWEYFEDEDARGINVDYDDDGKEIVIEYDYVKRTVPPAVLVAPPDTEIDID